MSLINLENAIWIFVAIIVIGVIICIVGYFSDSTNIESKGKYTLVSGLIFLVISFFVYAKIKHLQEEEKFVNKLLE